MMDDTTLDQRVRYLIEHGGLWEDPIADIRRTVRWALAISILSLATHLIELARLLR